MSKEKEYQVGHGKGASTITEEKFNNGSHEGYKIYPTVEEALKEEGFAWGYDHIRLTKEEFELLIQGQVFAYFNGEYVIYINLYDEEEEKTK